MCLLFQTDAGSRQTDPSKARALWEYVRLIPEEEALEEATWTAMAREGGQVRGSNDTESLEDICLSSGSPSKTETRPAARTIGYAAWSDSIYTPLRGDKILSARSPNIGKTKTSLAVAYSF